MEWKLCYSPSLSLRHHPCESRGTDLQGYGLLHLNSSISSPPWYTLLISIEGRSKLPMNPTFYHLTKCHYCSLVMEVQLSTGLHSHQGWGGDRSADQLCFPPPPFSVLLLPGGCGSSVSRWAFLRTWVAGQQGAC